VLFDALAVAGLFVVLILGNMRLLYGAWPWEAGKTWYHTREAVEYVAALRRARRERALRQLEDTFSASKGSLVVSVAPLPPRTGDASGDSFDRSLIVPDNSPSEVATPSKVPPTGQLRPVHPNFSIRI